MKLVFVDKNYCKPGITEVLHSTPFLGEANNDKKGTRVTAIHFLGDPVDPLLHISRSGLIKPPITMPGSSLVVNSNIRAILSDISNIQFLDVVFEKLVNFGAASGDFSFYQSKLYLSNPDKYRTDNLLSRLPNDESLHSTFPPYYEVVLANAFRCNRDAVKCEVSYQFLNTGPYGRESFPCTQRFLDEHPIFHCGPIAIQQSIFDRIQHGFDFDYFDLDIVTV